MTLDDPQPTVPPGAGRPARTRRLVLLVALGVLAVLAVTGLRYAGAVRALLDAQRQVQAARTQLKTLTHHPDAAGLREVEQHLQVAAQDLGERSERLSTGLEVRVLAHVPLLGGQVQGVQALRATAAAAVEVARAALPVVGEVLFERAPSGQPPSSHLEQLVAALTPELVGREQRALAGLDSGLAASVAHRLWWPLAASQDTLITTGRSVSTGGRQALAVGGGLREALGAGHHQYLILLGNPAEQRPGGGFIGLIGLVQAQDGRLGSTSFRDSYFRPSRVTDRVAPRALDEHLFVGRPWELPDANWSADFPTSAADVASFYRGETGQDVDGVIALSTTTIGELLRVVGPVPVPGFAQVVRPDNVLRELSSIANRIRPGDNGKGYLVTFGHELIQRVQQAKSAELPVLAGVLGRATGSRDLVLWMRSPTLQNLIASHGAGGQLTVLPGADQLMVTDANVSGGKNDLFVTRSASLRVAVAPNGTATHHLSLTYLQPRPANAEEAALQPGSGGSYRDYIEIRVPADAKLTGMQYGQGNQLGPSGPEAIDTDHGFRRFGFFLILPPGGSATVTFDYTTTAAFDRLVWQKQIQALAHPVDITVDWPARGTSRVTRPLDADLELRRPTG